MAASPPPASPATDRPRDMSLPPQPGEDVGMYDVVSCTPEELRLRVSPGLMLVVIGFCGAAVLWALFNLSLFRGSGYQYGHEGKYHGIILVAVVIAVWALVNIGRRMEIDRQRVRVTWAFFLTKEHPSHQFKSVNLEVVKPSPHAAAPPPAEGGPPLMPVANTAVLTLVGTAPGTGELRVKIGEAAMSTRNWPSLAAAAAYLSRLLRVPLVFDGVPEAASPPNRLLLTQVQGQAWAG